MWGVTRTPNHVMLNYQLPSLKTYYLLDDFNECVIAYDYPLYLSCAYPFQFPAVLLSYSLSFHDTLTPPCGASPSNQPTYLPNTIKFDPRIRMTKTTPTFPAIVRIISRNWKTNAMISSPKVGASVREVHSKGWVVTKKSKEITSSWEANVG